MELINRQDAIKALRDTFLGDTYEIDAVACGTIEGLKTVEAIPIEWLEEKMTGHPELPYAITDGITNGIIPAHAGNSNWISLVFC